MAACIADWYADFLWKVDTILSEIGSSEIYYAIRVNISENMMINYAIMQ